MASSFVTVAAPNWLRIDGTYVRDSSGKRIRTVDDVRKEIDGPGGATLVALWILLIR